MITVELYMWHLHANSFPYLEMDVCHIYDSLTAPKIK
jgi:hypothetical protein